jgi:hypothetical protein
MCLFQESKNIIFTCGDFKNHVFLLSFHCTVILHYCLTDLTVDSNDITVQKHYFHLWGFQKPLVAFATRDFFRPHS